MSDFNETALNRYLNAIDQLVAEDNARETWLEDAEVIATLEKIPASHTYSWAKWFVDESLARDDGSTPTTKEFYELVKEDKIDLFLDDGEAWDIHEDEGGPPMFTLA